MTEKKTLLDFFEPVDFKVEKEDDGIIPLVRDVLEQIHLDSVSNLKSGWYDGREEGLHQIAFSNDDDRIGFTGLKLNPYQTASFDGCTVRIQGNLNSANYEVIINY